MVLAGHLLPNKAALTLHSSPVQGREYKTKGLQVELRTGRDHSYNYSYRQNRPNLRKLVSITANQIRAGQQEIRAWWDFKATTLSRKHQSFPWLGSEKPSLSILHHNIFTDIYCTVKIICHHVLSFTNFCRYQNLYKYIKNLKNSSVPKY